MSGSVIRTIPDYLVSRVKQGPLLVSICGPGPDIDLRKSCLHDSIDHAINRALGEYPESHDSLHVAACRIEMLQLFPGIPQLCEWIHENTSADRIFTLDEWKDVAEKADMKGWLGDLVRRRFNEMMQTLIGVVGGKDGATFVTIQPIADVPQWRVSPEMVNSLRMAT